MTTPLPPSLARYGEQLERAVERDRRALRSRRRVAVRLLALAGIAVATTLGAVSVLMRADSITVAPPALAKAERAAAVLSAPPGSIVHEAANYRAVGADGRVSTWREEAWRETARPYARRQVTTREGGARIETATVADRPAELYDATTNTIYTNAPDAGAALGTPMPAGDGDPLRDQLVALLRSADARAPARLTADGRAALRFRYENPLPDGGAVQWTYVVDAATYEPIRITTTSPDGSRVTARFETYEALAATQDTRARLSLRARHPTAATDATEAGYRAAQARLYSLPAGG